MGNRGVVDDASQNREAIDQLRACLSDRLEAHPELESLLMGDIACARARWPDLTLPILRYLERVSELMDEGDLTLSQHPHRHELLLVMACAEQDPCALAILEKEYFPHIRNKLTRTVSSSAKCDDLMQSLWEHLLIAKDDARPHICKFAGRGKLESWLRVVALRLASSFKPRLEEPIPVLTDKLYEALPSRCPDPELRLLKETYKMEFSAAFREAIASLDSREQAVLMFNLVEGLRSEQIAEIYGVHRTTVIRWLSKAQAQVVERTVDAMKRSLSVADDELRSIFRLIQSQVSLKL